MPLVFALIALMTWLAASRWLFRRWVRNDSLTAWDKQCSHGYRKIHKRDACRGYAAPKPWAITALAVAAGLAFPAVLFVLAVTHNPPESRRERAERTASLEAENERLQQARAASVARETSGRVSHGHDDYEEDEFY
jgi:HAMP domain-containing protein